MNMRGHIAKKGNKYYVVVDIGKNYKTGKRQQKWFSGYDKKEEAEYALAEIIYKLKQGNLVLPDNTRLGEYLIYWLERYKKKLATTTYNTYNSIINNHLIPNLGNIPLQQLKPLHIEDYYYQKQNELSQRTLLHHHRVLSLALKNAVGWQLIPNNPCDYVEAPKPKKYKATALTPEQSKELLNLVKDTDMETPITLILATGIRRGELLALTWNDIDFDNKILSIDKSLAVDEETKELIIKEPKSKSSIRTISLSDGTINILKQHKVKQNEEKLKLGKYYKDNNLVFATPDGSLINPSTFSKKFGNIIKGSNLPHIRLHDLRHTNATLMLKSKIPAKVASERLGHSNTATTLDIYSHVLKSMQEEAADKLDKMLGF